MSLKINYVINITEESSVLNNDFSFGSFTNTILHVVSQVYELNELVGKLYFRRAQAYGSDKLKRYVSSFSWNCWDNRDYERCIYSIFEWILDYLSFLPNKYTLCRRTQSATTWKHGKHPLPLKPNARGPLRIWRHGKLTSVSKRPRGWKEHLPVETIRPIHYC